MKTDLETMIGYLAGRDGGGTAQLRADFDDPQSDASRFLEDARVRTRALLADEPTAQKPYKPAAPARDKRRRVSLLAGATALILISAAIPLGVSEFRERRLQATLERSEAEARAQALRIEAAIARSTTPPRPITTPPVKSKDEPIALALNKVEEGLGKLERRLDGLSRPAPSAPPASAPPPPEGPDPSLSEIRSEIAAIRRESASSEQATARQLQEMRTVLQELNQVIRRAVNTPQNVQQGPMMMPNMGPGLTPIEAAQLQSLVNNLSSPHPQVRLEAAEHLSRLGQEARPAVHHLRQMLPHESDTRVRNAAQAAIRHLQPD